MMTGYLNPHGTMPHLYPQFEGMWFDPDNNDNVSTDELGEPSYLAFSQELGGEEDGGFNTDEFGEDDCLYCDDDREPPLQTVEEIAKWVADRYWYILTEIEMISKTAEAVPEIVPSGEVVCACGGKRSTMLELDPKEHEDRLYSRWIKRDKHGRGRLTEVSWKRHAGGGRRGRTTLRTMVEQSSIGA